jgi:molybdate transport system ATP-binding protein
MTDLFQKKIASKMVLSGFFDSIGLYTQPHITKKIVSQWLELVRLNHLKKYSLKHFQLDSKDLLLLYVPY